MKKLLVYPLLFLYFLSCTGIIVSVHYCSSRISDVSFNQKATCCCDGDEDENSFNGNDCCSDQVIKVAVAKDQLPSLPYSLDYFLAPALLPSFPVATYTNDPAEIGTRINLSARSHAPPGQKNLPKFYTLYSSLVYYG